MGLLIKKLQTGGITRVSAAINYQPPAPPTIDPKAFMTSPPQKKEVPEFELDDDLEGTPSEVDTINANYRQAVNKLQDMIVEEGEEAAWTKKGRALQREAKYWMNTAIKNRAKQNLDQIKDLQKHITKDSVGSSNQWVVDSQGRVRVSTFDDQGKKQTGYVDRETVVQDLIEAQKEERAPSFHVWTNAEALEDWYNVSPFQEDLIDAVTQTVGLKVANKEVDEAFKNLGEEKQKYVNETFGLIVQGKDENGDPVYAKDFFGQPIQGVTSITYGASDGGGNDLIATNRRQLQTALKATLDTMSKSARNAYQNLAAIHTASVLSKNPDAFFMHDGKLVKTAEVATEDIPDDAVYYSDLTESDAKKEFIANVENSFVQGFVAERLMRGTEVERAYKKELSSITKPDYAGASSAGLFDQEGMDLYVQLANGIRPSITAGISQAIGKEGEIDFGVTRESLEDNVETGFSVTDNYMTLTYVNKKGQKETKLSNSFMISHNIKSDARRLQAGLDPFTKVQPKRKIIHAGAMLEITGAAEKGRAADSPDIYATDVITEVVIMLDPESPVNQVDENGKPIPPKVILAVGQYFFGKAEDYSATLNTGKHSIYVPKLSKEGNLSKIAPDDPSTYGVKLADLVNDLGDTKGNVFNLSGDDPFMQHDDIIEDDNPIYRIVSKDNLITGELSVLQKKLKTLGSYVYAGAEVTEELQARALGAMETLNEGATGEEFVLFKAFVPISEFDLTENQMSRSQIVDDASNRFNVLGDKVKNVTSIFNNAGSVNLSSLGLDSKSQSAMEKAAGK